MFSIFHSKSRGFTLIEMLIATAIIVILSAIFFLSYRSGQRNMALQRASHKLAQDIRRVQSMAGLEEIDCKTFGSGSDEFHSNYKYGYGICLKETDSERYKLFADCNGNQKYDNPEEEIETIEFEKEVEIYNLSSNLLKIVFVPPDPSVYINGSSSTGPAEITIRLKKDISKTKTITVYNSGLIDY